MNLEKKVGLIETMTEGQEKNDKIKEAKHPVDTIRWICKRRRIKKTIKALDIEVDNFKKSQKPATLGLSRGQGEFEQSITQFQLSPEEEEELQFKRNKEINGLRLVPPLGNDI